MRTRILGLLDGRVASPRQLSDELDAKGRKALTKELEATIARVDRIQEQARKRLGHDHAAEERMTLVMLRFDDVAVPDDGNKARGTRRRTTSRSSTTRSSRSRARSSR